VLRRAVLASGGRGILTELLLPGARVQIILGLRTSVALGWRAFVAAEMLAGASGLRYVTTESVQSYKTDVVLLGMIVIGLLWLLVDRLLFVRSSGRPSSGRGCTSIRLVATRGRPCVCGERLEGASLGASTIRPNGAAC
jgi:ABC-type proline/glycine betaine transport system permease subunit